MGKFKVGYDLASFAVSLVLSLLFFGRIVGIGVGSVACAFLNGILISFWCRVIERFFDFSPRFREGQSEAREHGMYMQKYCGCIFSEEDRYMAAKRKKKQKQAGV